MEKKRDRGDRISYGPRSTRMKHFQAQPTALIIRFIYSKVIDFCFWVKLQKSFRLIYVQNCRLTSLAPLHSPLVGLALLAWKFHSFRASLTARPNWIKASSSNFTSTGGDNSSNWIIPHAVATAKAVALFFYYITGRTTINL